ncbi:MAG TPA: DoxX family protein [Casimicrobiaceae bacterium]
MVPEQGFFSMWTPRVRSLLRIVVGGLFLQHGTAKLLHIPHVPSFDHVQLMSLVGVAGVLEIVGGLLLLIGLFTRPVAFVLSGEMAFAYFLAHGERNLLPILNGGELAAIYSFVFLYFAVAGAGLWSIDERSGVQQHTLRRGASDDGALAHPAHQDAERQP